MKGWKLWAALGAAGLAIWWYLRRQQQPANIAQQALPKGGGGAAGDTSMRTNPLDLIKQLGQTVLSGKLPQAITNKTSPITAQMGMMSQLDINKMVGGVADAVKGLLAAAGVGRKTGTSTAPAPAELGLSESQLDRMLAEYEGGYTPWLDTFNRSSYNPNEAYEVYTQPYIDSLFDLDSSTWLETELEADAAEVGLTAGEWAEYLGWN